MSLLCAYPRLLLAFRRPVVAAIDALHGATVEVLPCLCFSRFKPLLLADIKKGWHGHHDQAARSLALILGNLAFVCIVVSMSVVEFRFAL
jgi:hypothetical protein